MQERPTAAITISRPWAAPAVIYLVTRRAVVPRHQAAFGLWFGLSLHDRFGFHLDDRFGRHLNHFFWYRLHDWCQIR